MKNRSIIYSKSYLQNAIIMAVENRAEVVDGRWRREDGEEVSWDPEDEGKSAFVCFDFPSSPCGS